MSNLRLQIPLDNPERTLYIHPFNLDKFSNLQATVVYMLEHNPDSNHLLGQRWHFVGSFVGPTSTHFAHRANLIANRRFDVGLHMPT